MIILRTLGSLNLLDPEGNEVAAVLSQPKRFALLVYLALGPVGELHRRDTLLTLFWPELDEARARNALSQALSFLRRHLPEKVVITRGANRVGVAPDSVQVDVHEFQKALAGARWARAMEAYRGDFLPGFHVGHSAGFEEWMEVERTRLQEAAAEAAWSLAHREVEAGSLIEGERTAEKALDLGLINEASVREFMHMLAASGSPAAALTLFEKLRSRLEEDLELEPSAATVEAAGAIRNRVEEHGVEPDPAHHSPTLEEAVSPPSAEPGNHPRKGRPGRVIYGVAAVAVAAVLLVTLSWKGSSGLDEGRVLVLPFENRTGNPALDELELMAADWICEAIQDLPEVTLVPLAVSRQYGQRASRANPRDLIRNATRETGSGWAVSGIVASRGDSIQFWVELIHARGQRRAQLVVEEASKDWPMEAIPRLAQRVGGALIVEFDPLLRETEAGSAPLPRPPTLEAYKEHRLGYEAFGLDYPASFAHHMAAYALDTTLVRALVAAAYVAPNREMEDSLARMADSRRRFLSVRGQRDLDIKLAMLRADWQTPLRILRNTVREHPNTFSSVSMAFFALLNNLPQEAVEALAGYDPNLEWRSDEEYLHWDYLTQSLHLLGDYERELREARRGREQSPRQMVLLGAEARALAALGRVEEVSGLLHEAPSLPGDATRTAIMAGRELRAHGSAEGARQIFRWALERTRGQVPGKDGTNGNEWRNAVEAAYGAEEWREAHRRAQGWLEAFPEEIDAVGMVGVTAARLSDSALALETVEKLVDMPRPGFAGRSAGCNLLWGARILALLGRPDEAMDFLESSVDHGLRFGVYLHRIPDLNLLRQREDFQAMMRPKG